MSHLNTGVNFTERVRSSEAEVDQLRGGRGQPEDLEADQASHAETLRAREERPQSRFDHLRASPGKVQQERRPVR
jgi:hypothetical protein